MDEVLGPLPDIPLSEEEKAILDEPVDHRVQEILMQIQIEKAAAERAKKALKKPSSDQTGKGSDVLV